MEKLSSRFSQHHGPTPTAATVQEGSRVRITGLQAKPQHNGRTGVVCGAFDQESGRWTVEVDASDAGPAFQGFFRPSNLTILPVDDLQRRPEAPSMSANIGFPDEKAALKEGSSVRITGLQAKPQHNGRTGVICGTFDQESGRWTVEVDASDAGPAFQGFFRPSNLTILPVIGIPQCEDLVRLLGSSDAEVQIEAVIALQANTFGQVKNKDSYLNAGAAAAICVLLQSPDAILQEKAAECVANMCLGQHVRSQDAFRDAGCMPLLANLLLSSSLDVQNWSCQALLQLSDGHNVNTAKLCDVVLKSTVATANGHNEARNCDASIDGPLLCPLVSILKSNSEGSLVLCALQVIQIVVQAGQKGCLEQGKISHLMFLERCGLPDAVICLQTSAEGDVKRLANDCVLKCGILKMVCGDVGADNHVTSAAACSRLRRTLQACICDAVADTVVDCDVPSHLVRLLTSATPSPISSVDVDCAICIGILSSKHQDLSKQDEIVTLFSIILMGLDADVIVHCLHSFASVIGSVGGNTREGLLVITDNFLSTHGNDVIIRQIVASQKMLPTFLDLLRSSPTSDCFRSVMSILKKILQSGHSHGQVAIGSSNSYVAHLNTLGAVQAIQCSDCFRTADTVVMADEVLHFFYEFLTLEEKLRLLVSRRPVPPSPALQLRPRSLIMSSLRGDMNAVKCHPEWLNSVRQQRVVRFFVSSTFDDTKHERDVLIKCVMPALQRYARAVGFEVVLSEMRFGIRKALTDDHKTSEVCIAELQRCVETSAGLSYVLLSCNRYGFRAPPRRIPACDMDVMIGCMTPDNVALVLEYYTLDENELRTPQECYNISVNMHGASNIAGAAYVLKNVSSVQDFWPRFSSLQLALRNAADRHWPNASSTYLRDPQSQHPIKFFFFSITEEEISRGVLWRDSDHIEKSVHVFQRTLFAPGGGELQQMPVDSPELKNYIDLSSDKTAADLVATNLLKGQQQMISQSLSQISSCFTSFDPLEWRDGKGIDPLNALHAAYLEQFASKTLAILLKSVDQAREHLNFEPNIDMEEAIFHLQFAAHGARMFAKSSETQHVTTKLRHYLARAIGDTRAFVIYGASGSGKTYLIAEAVHSEVHALNSSRDAVIVRFLGTSPASSNLVALLGSLCRQLHFISITASALPSMDDVEKLKEYFQNALKTWQTGRLTVFLDSLDQLDDTWGGRTLGWLPTHGLSPNVRLVVSTLPDEPAPADGKPFACLSILQKRYSEDNACIAEVQPVEDLRSLFLHHLKNYKRKLSDNQLQVLEAIIKVSPRLQTPLVVAILALRFSEWPSHKDFPHDNKNPDNSIFIDTSSVRAIIIQDFRALEIKHGSELVRAVLSFITLAKDGLSETELFEILSLDDDVLASVYEWWVPPVRTLPTNPLTMLLADLKPYLTMRGNASGGGGHMMCWYHRLFWEAADDYFLRDTKERRFRHALLGEFFSGIWANRCKPYNHKLQLAVQKKIACEFSGDRRVRPQPLCLREGKSIFETKGDIGAVNERRCREASYHLLAAGMFSKVADELCNFEGIYARIRCGEVSVLMHQLNELVSLIRAQIRTRDIQAAQALQQLLRVEHYTNWLRKDISVIVIDPDIEIFVSCSRQPERSLARQELQAYLRQTSAGVKIPSCCSWYTRSFVLGPVLPNFGCCISEMRYHTSEVLCVSFNTDCSMLASSSSDGWVAIWNPKTSLVENVLKGVSERRTSGETVKPGDFHGFMQTMKKGIKSVSWSPDGRWLVTGHTDDTVRLWDVRMQQEIGVFRGHKSQVESVSFCQEGKCVASGSLDGSVRLWEVRTRQEKAVLLGHTGGIRSVQWKGKSVASGSQDTTVRLWDASTHKVVAVLRGHSRGVLSLAFDASGELIASGSEDRTIRLWDVDRQHTVAVFTGHSAWVLSLAFDPSGKLIASGSDDRTIRLWDVSSRKGIVLPYAGDIGHTNSVAFDKSGKILASGHDNGIARLWNVSMQPEQVQDIRDEIVCVAFDRSGRYIASGFYNSIRLWDVFTQQEVAVIRSPTSAAGWGSHTIHQVGKKDVGWGLCCIAFDVSGKCIASGSVDKTIRLWDVITRQEVALFLGHTGRIKSVAFDGSGKYMASGSDDKTVRLWSVSERREIAVLKGHTEEVLSVAFDGSGKYIASGSSDMTVRLWDSLTCAEVACLTDVASPVTCVSFSPNSSLVAAGSCDGFIRLWNTSSCTSVANFAGHTRAATCCLAWSGDEFLTALGACDGSISVFEALSGQLRCAVLQCPEAVAVRGITLSSDACLLAVAVTTTSCVHVFDVVSASLLSSCALRGSAEQLHWSANGVLKDGQGDLWRLH
jgi:WD40 repeat protein